MGFTPQRKKRSIRSNGGVALFMVISAMTILSILIVEFTYVSQVNQRMAFDSVDQVKALYLAKSALKISLLRLKAYQTLKSLGKSSGGSGGSSTGGFQVPQFILDKVWSFPFVFPLPKNLPGLSIADKDRIEKFQKESNLDGNFTALIEAESSRYNLNTILSEFTPAAPSPTPSPSPGSSPSPSPSPSPDPSQPNPSGSPTAFNKDEARKNMGLLLTDILQSKFEADPDFATEYRDLRVDDLLDSIVTWADWSYESRLYGRDNPVPPKRAPFYHVSELHMIPLMDDKLYDVFAPTFTASITQGINVNKIQEPVLRSLIPRITEEELKKFFEYRDDPVEDHLFKKDEDFFTYLKTHINVFRGDAEEVRRFKEGLEKRGVRAVVDETEFKITVQAHVRQATKLIEAWVTVAGQKQNPGGPTSSPQPGASPSPNPAQPSGFLPQKQSKPDTGLKITFMRIL